MTGALMRAICHVHLSAALAADAVLIPFVVHLWLINILSEFPLVLNKYFTGSKQKIETSKYYERSQKQMINKIGKLFINDSKRIVFRCYYWLDWYSGLYYTLPGRGHRNKE